MPPFIVTLGTWSVFFALNLWYSESETIRAQDIETDAPLLQFFGTAIEIAAGALHLRLDLHAAAVPAVLATC